MAVGHLARASHVMPSMPSHGEISLAARPRLSLIQHDEAPDQQLSHAKCVIGPCARRSRYYHRPTFFPSCRFRRMRSAINI